MQVFFILFYLYGGLKTKNIDEWHYVVGMMTNFKLFALQP